MPKARRLLVMVLILALLALIVSHFLQRAIGEYQIHQSELPQTYLQLEDPGHTTTLSILPLFEAWSQNEPLQSGHGVSYLIKTDTATILLDLGNNESRQSPSPLQHNMQTLGLAFDDIDTLVISHNHPDHVGGFDWWRRRSFSADSQQEALQGKTVYLPEALKHPQTDPVASLEPTQIAAGVVSLGAMPFLETLPLGLLDPRGREQALAILVQDQGVVLVMGCGHPTLERLVKRAEALFDAPVIGVVGGLHYLDSTEEALQPHIEFLQQRNPQLVALSPHDSSGFVLQTFEAAFPDAYRYIVVGHPITLP